MKPGAFASNRSDRLERDLNEDDNVLPKGLPEALLQKILVDNPLATYPRLKEAAS